MTDSFARTSRLFSEQSNVAFWIHEIPLRYFPQDIIDQYNIMYLVDKYGFVYVDLRKGMYGLK